MKIAFRTDASLEIGTGHVMRCLTLARALRGAGATCRFITRALPGHLGERIATEGFEVTLLPVPEGAAPQGPPTHAKWAGVDWPQDAAETRAALDEATDWLVMDHYAFDARWQRAARPEGTRLMVIDDLADRPHDCDVLLDQNLGRMAEDYHGLVPDRCVKLIGPQYALLRPEFAAARARAIRERTGRGLCHLLITMGGVDRVDATSSVLNGLWGATLPEGLRITVIMGGQAPALARVRALAAAMPRPTEVAVDVADMAARMASADLAISAGGGTTWERCCLGLPSIIVETAGNQAGIARAMAAAGAALDPGPLQSAGFARALQSALSEASDAERLDAMSENAAAICDGDGTARVTTLLLSRHQKADTDYHVRFADMDDAKDVWRWRNAGGASKYYRSKTPAPLDSHMEWFKEALKNPDRLLLVVEKESMRLGHVRIDRKNGQRHEAEISVYINPHYRGKGHGTKVIENAMKFAKKYGVQIYTAEVHTDNSASLNVFQRAGFRTVSCDNHFFRMIVDETRKF